MRGARKLFAGGHRAGRGTRTAVRGDRSLGTGKRPKALKGRGSASEKLSEALAVSVRRAARMVLHRSGVLPARWDEPTRSFDLRTVTPSVSFDGGSVRSFLESFFLRQKTKNDTPGDNSSRPSRIDRYSKLHLQLAA